MRFTATKLPGVMLIEATPQRDERGAFARVYCPEEFKSAGIAFQLVQISVSSNLKRHTLRGLHWQNPPYAEPKVVRAVRGRAYDVVVDLRPDSPAYRQWINVTLDADQKNAVFIPEGCAHGFMTLVDETDILYQMGIAYAPGQARGARWNDPAFAIDWPAAPAVMADADRHWPDLASPAA
jgi:dTDP-4-dehydrorhamnose 3,5-epimerase